MAVVRCRAGKELVRFAMLRWVEKGGIAVGAELLCIVEGWGSAAAAAMAASFPPSAVALPSLALARVGGLEALACSRGRV